VDAGGPGHRIATAGGRRYRAGPAAVQFLDGRRVRRDRRRGDYESRGQSGLDSGDGPAKTVALVDLDLTLGDADVFLDAVHDYTLFDVAQNMSRLDFDLLRRSLTKLDSGLYLLPRPVTMNEARLISDSMLRRVLGLLKASFSHLVIDVSKGYNTLDLMALECCDTALLVTQLDLPSLRNVVRLLKSFEAVSQLSDKVKIVLNRGGPEEGPIRLKKAQEIMDRAVFWQIPNDYRLMMQACNSGRPLIQMGPKAEITRSIGDMARALCGETVSPDARLTTNATAAPGLAKWLRFWPSSSAAAAK
jgi:pilus assembly protein CpaE